jgi:hypothetical protein
LNLCLLASWIKRYNAGEGKLWKDVLDYKYDTRNPNIFCGEDHRMSNFWKGVKWAAAVAKLGYRWKIGIGREVRFMEDVWLGNCSLVAQYWEIYVLINEHNKSVWELWGGQELKCSFRRTVDEIICHVGGGNTNC